MHREHQECIALWGGMGITIRNSHIYNCAVFHLWIVAESRADDPEHPDREQPVHPARAQTGPPSAPRSRSATTADAWRSIVLRGNRVLVDEMYIVQGYDDGGNRGHPPPRQPRRRAHHARQPAELHADEDLQAEARRGLPVRLEPAGPQVSASGQPGAAAGARQHRVGELGEQRRIARQHVDRPSFRELESLEVRG